jgi:hypothetical protein
MVLDHAREHDSEWAAIRSIADKIGCTAETLRKCTRQAERDAGDVTQTRKVVRKLLRWRWALGRRYDLAVWDLAGDWSAPGFRSVLWGLVCRPDSRWCRARAVVAARAAG